ncbi:sulfatase-like hydrolase/transferase [Paenibacillus sp. IB182496]|uniref:Sulfatase-like hydrolase/transferase n=1 Tax=Paenibacillus sabuli TaxID=2772509 RepID=A0A927BQX6_9BACL|nr:sulfatase-like hydrolase/transferase [Paenibacillus sabuli]MBD2844060.1 sulfatase-like hydrolase/transferase [Paenibacillus sabuli]
MGNKAFSNRNVLIICADEMRGDCAGFMGNPDIKTPNLDRLAGQSVVFEQFMTVFPKCMPARASMMTGRYCHTGAWRTVAYQHLPAEQTTLLERFREQGYETAVLGKNHCWDTQVYERDVDYRSYSGELGQLMEGVPRIRVHEPNPNGAIPLELEDGWDYIGCNTRFADDEVKAEQAIRYLRDYRDRSKPFFLQVNIEAPHPVYGVEEPYYSMYDREGIAAWPHTLPKGATLPMIAQRKYRTGESDNERAVREIQSVYYGMITKVDTLVGSILAELEEQGLDRNTLVLFWSDHGDYAGQYGLVEKWDTCFQDCLMHVPFLMRGPGLPEGKRIGGLGDTTDIAPTLCELLGFEPLPGMHGESLLPAIHGGGMKRAVFADGGHEDALLLRAEAEMGSQMSFGADQPARRDAKSITYASCPDAMARAKMVRTDKYKLIIRLRGGNELYDMEADPQEMNNRWGDPALAEVLPELMQLMIEWCLRTDPEEPHLARFTV